VSSESYKHSSRFHSGTTLSLYCLANMICLFFSFQQSRVYNPGYKKCLAKGIRLASPGQVQLDGHTGLKQDLLGSVLTCHLSI